MVVVVEKAHKFNLTVDDFVVVDDVSDIVAVVVVVAIDKIPNV